MPKSTAVITDLTAVTTGTFTAASLAKAIAAAGPIQDLVGNAAVALVKAQELKALLTQMKAGIDGGDTLLTTQIQAVIDVLV